MFMNDICANSDSLIHELIREGIREKPLSTSCDLLPPRDTSVYYKTDTDLIQQRDDALIYLSFDTTVYIPLSSPYADLPILE